MEIATGVRGTILPDPDRRLTYALQCKGRPEFSTDWAIRHRPPPLTHLTASDSSSPPSPASSVSPLNFSEPEASPRQRIFPKPSPLSKPSPLVRNTSKDGDPRLFAREKVSTKLASLGLDDQSKSKCNTCGHAERSCSRCSSLFCQRCLVRTGLPRSNPPVCAACTREKNMLVRAKGGASSPMRFGGKV